MYDFAGLKSVEVWRAAPAVQRIDRTQWERLNEAFGEALVDEAAGAELLAGDPALLNRHRVGEPIQEWIRRASAPTLEDLAQQILLAFGS